MISTAADVYSTCYTYKEWGERRKLHVCTYLCFPVGPFLHCGNYTIAVALYPTVGLFLCPLPKMKGKQG